MTTEQWANRSKSTLAGASTSGATTLTIASPASGQDFPSAAPFRVICGTEIMLVTARAALVFTVTRGIEGTTAAAHASGAVISHGVTAGALTDLQSLAANETFGVTFTGGGDVALRGDGTIVVKRY